MGRAMEEHAFEEQEESVRLMDLHRDDLVAEARTLLAQQPGAAVVGVVMAGDSAEAAEFRKFVPKGTVVGERAVVVMLMPRQWVLAILRAKTPAQLDWMESGPDKLPLLCITRTGTRLGWAPLR